MDTLGGGICQISSTLYYSTLFADLEIVRRYNHGYVSDYIDPGMDATVTWGGADFRFKNNTDYPIRIEAWRADGYVNVNDVTAMQRHVAEMEPLTGDCLAAADIDGDGVVTISDASELQRFLAEFETAYPIGR